MSIHIFQDNLLLLREQKKTVVMFGYNPNEYELKTELTTCYNGVGTVYFARHRPTGQHISVKKYKMDNTKEENNLITVIVQILLQKKKHK